MKVRNLIEQLQSCNQNDEVVIPVKDGRDMGQEPHVRVQYISRGFDWDNGKVFLRPADSISLRSI